MKYLFWQSNLTLISITLSLFCNFILFWFYKKFKKYKETDRNKTIKSG